MSPPRSGTPLSLDLPFKPRKGSSETQLGYILGRLEELVRQESCGDHYDLDLDDLNVWLLDESGRPTGYVSGWMRVQVGSRTAAEMTKWSPPLSGDDAHLHQVSGGMTPPF